MGERELLWPESVIPSSHPSSANNIYHQSAMTQWPCTAAAAPQRVFNLRAPTVNLSADAKEREMEMESTWRASWATVDVACLPLSLSVWLYGGALMVVGGW